MNTPIEPAGWSRAELEALRAVAMAATPGRWQNGIDDLEGVVAPDNPGLGNVICIPPLKRMYSSLEHWPENAAQIAAFDPPTVIKLIDAIMALAPPSSVARERVTHLERGIAEIMAGLVSGKISGEDIVWASEIETLWERCHAILDPQQSSELPQTDDADEILAALAAAPLGGGEPAPHRPA